HGIDRGKGQNRKADTGPRLGGAINIAAVEQAADQPLMPGFAPLGGTRRTHCLSSCEDTEPVVLGASAAASMVLSMAPIGSRSPGRTKLGGRSGRFFSWSY